MHRVLLVLTVFVFGAEVYAQRFVIKGGINLSSINATFETRKIKYGALLGIGFEYPLSAKFFVQPEFNFVQKGYKYEHEYKNDLGYGFLRRALESSYLEIPILFKYRLNSGVVKYSFLIGPSVGGVIGGNLKTYSVSAYRLPPDIYESKQTRKIRIDDWPYPGDGSGNGFEIIEHWLELGLQAGGQVEFFDKVILDIRYGFGLTSFYSLRFTETVPSGKLENTKNRGIQVSVSVPFKKL